MFKGRRFLLGLALLSGTSLAGFGMPANVAGAAVGPLTTTFLETNSASSFTISQSTPSTVRQSGNTLSIFSYAPGPPVTLTITTPDGQPVRPGLYDNSHGSIIAIAPPETINRFCNVDPASSVFIDQASFTNGQPTTLGIEFDVFCPDLGNEYFGTVAFNLLPTTPHQGYYMYGDDGSLTGFGNDAYLNYFGDLSAATLNNPVVGAATTPDGAGYWMAASDGGIFSYGDAQFFGSTGALHLNKPIVGIAGTPSGNGYWLVASDGGIFTFGDARFSGSTGAIHLNKPIVGMAATPSGNGYWLVASDGGIFAFGDAQFYGSTGALVLNKPIVGMALTPSGHGYWLVATDGGIFAFGDAPFYGSTGALHLNQPIVGMTPTNNGGGYWLVAQDGGLFTFGNAPFLGSLGGTGVTNEIGMFK